PSLVFVRNHPVGAFVTPQQPSLLLSLQPDRPCSAVSLGRRAPSSNGNPPCHLNAPPAALNRMENLESLRSNEVSRSCIALLLWIVDYWNSRRCHLADRANTSSKWPPGQIP